MLRKIFMVSLVCIAFGCDTDEAEFPEVVTYDAQQIGRTSVVLEAEIMETGSIRPIQYGFLWGTQSGLNLFNAQEKLDLGSADGMRKFSIKLDDLAPGTNYFVRSYAAHPDYSRIFYGNEIVFSTLN